MLQELDEQINELEDLIKETEFHRYTAVKYGYINTAKSFNKELDDLYAEFDGLTAEYDLLVKQQEGNKNG